MSIRRLEGAEREGAIPELATILADCVQGGASVGFVLPFTALDAETYWRQAAPRMDVLLVAGNGRRIDGTVSLKFAEFPNGRHRAEVVKLLVHRGARGQGLATALMAALEEEARAAGRTTLVLDSDSDSDAVRLYRGLGWEESGSVPRYCLSPDGRLKATTFMHKLLQKGDRPTEPSHG
jgi:ribosomal protein S18 acetylase RimI-like enzyme